MTTLPRQHFGARQMIKVYEGQHHSNPPDIGGE